MSATALNPRVLVVEDDPAMRDLLVEVLSELPCQPVTLPMGPSLTERFVEEAAGCRLVISDVRLPGGNGLVLLTALHQHGHGMPVILISAFCSDALLAEAARLGAWRVLSKPFPPEALLSVVSPLLSGGEK